MPRWQSDYYYMSKITDADIKTATNRLPVTAPESTSRPNQEQAQLEELEKIIHDNLESSFKLADALREIRDSKLYRLEYKTFDEYCKKRWEYGRSYCSRLCDVSEVLDDLGESQAVVVPKNEAQARLYVNLEKDERIQLAEKVAEEADGQDLTAKLIARYKKELFPDKCIVESKKKKSPPAIIDVESTVEVVGDKPNFKKISITIRKLQSLMLTEEREGVLGALLEELSTHINPWVNSGEPQPIKGT